MYGKILLAILIQSESLCKCLIALSANIIEIIKIIALMILHTNINLIIELKCVLSRGFLVLK